MLAAMQENGFRVVSGRRAAESCRRCLYPFRHRRACGRMTYPWGKVDALDAASMSDDDKLPPNPLPYPPFPPKLSNGGMGVWAAPGWSGTGHGPTCMWSDDVSMRMGGDIQCCVDERRRGQSPTLSASLSSFPAEAFDKQGRRVLRTNELVSRHA